MEKNEHMVSVLIGMNNSWGMVSKDTMYSMLGLMMYSDRRGIHVHLTDPDEHLIYQGRNKIVKQAQEQKYDYVFFADADMTWPPFTLEHLLQWNVSIVSGWYMRQAYPHEIYIMFERGDKPGYYNHIHPDADELKRRTLQRCDAVGAGCLLVRTGVFLELDEPYFGWAEGGKSDDVWFCENARKNGYRIYADTSVLCGHVNTIVYPMHFGRYGIMRTPKTEYYLDGNFDIPPNSELNFDFLKEHPLVVDPRIRTKKVLVSELKKLKPKQEQGVSESG